jgi:DHA1 family tetracycline resistance protein-like MFS transporter
MSFLSRLRSKRAALAFIFVTAVLDIVAMGIIIPVLPQLIVEFVGSNAEAGWINGVFVALWAGMQFLCSPVIGSLSDQYGRRPVILISCAGLSIDYVLMAVAPNLWWLALGRIIAGVFLYGLLVLPESLPAEKRMTFSWRRANPVGALVLLRRHAELSGLAVVNFLLYFAHHVFSAVFVLYAALRYGWGPKEVGLLLALVGVLDMAVQGGLTGWVVKRLGDRATMILGLFGGALGVALMGWAPTGWAFVAAMLPNALWGLAMPTLQALMTRRVGDDEQGQLQGANMSVASIAGVASPLFFGWVYSVSTGGGYADLARGVASHGDWTAPLVGALFDPGLAFYVAAGVLFLAAVIGWVVARRAEREESAAV